MRHGFLGLGPRRNTQRRRPLLRFAGREGATQRNMPCLPILHGQGKALACLRVVDGRCVRARRLVSCCVDGRARSACGCPPLLPPRQRRRMRAAAAAAAARRAAHNAGYWSFASVANRKNCLPMCLISMLVRSARDDVAFRPCFDCRESEIRDVHSWQSGSLPLMTVNFRLPPGSWRPAPLINAGSLPTFTSLCNHRTQHPFCCAPLSLFFVKVTVARHHRLTTTVAR